ncbi:MAG: cyclic nucleotide-binding domain-containing protein [Deltaproteobacteria bacterium]|nr:cyclic nucleotide-binding domain-containing protein [Deltaproteobacteria bacterium]
MPVNPDSLLTLNVFCELDEDIVKALAGILIEKAVPSGTHLFLEDQKGETVFFIMEGKVGITRKGPDGGPVELYEAEEGDFLGEFSLFESGIRQVTATTKEDCQLLMLRRKDFLKFADRNAVAAFRFAWEMGRSCAEKIRGLEQILMDGFGRTLESKA